MSFACARTLRSIASNARVRSASLVSFERRASAQARIELSGVLSSCETSARNSSLARLAVSAACRASSSWRARSASRAAGAQHGKVGGQLRRDHRQPAHVPFFVGAVGAVHEKDADHLVEPDQRNGEVRPRRRGWPSEACPCSSTSRPRSAVDRGRERGLLGRRRSGRVTRRGSRPGSASSTAQRS